MFKGFGKPKKLSPMEYLCKVMALATATIKEDKGKKFAASQGQLFVLMYKAKPHKTKGQECNIFQKGVRWDLLNPGKPHLVPFEAGIEGDATLNNAHILWDRQINSLVYAVPLNDDEIKVISFSLDTMELLEINPETAEAFRRYQVWAVMDSLSHMVIPGSEERFKQEMAKELGDCAYKLFA